MRHEVGVAPGDLPIKNVDERFGDNHCVLVRAHESYGLNSR